MKPLKFSPTKRVTIQDVAKIAGVSLGTVSAAFNNGNVGERTKQRVLGIAERMGYRPNLIARSMVTKKTRVLGLIMPWNNVELTDAATASAASLGYSLMVCFSNDQIQGGERGGIDHLLERLIDGLIILPMQSQREDYGEVFAKIRSSETEAITIDRYFQEIKVDSVVTDNIRGASLATQHLLDLHHRDILFIVIENYTSTIRDRIDGFHRTLSQAGVRFNEHQVILADYLQANAVDHMSEILLNRGPATAIFAGNDHVAFDVMLACRKLGLRIPEDISLVGFDDILLGPHRICEILQPPLTTVRQNYTEMVRLAIRLLVERLEGKRTGLGQVHYIEPELIVRESTRSYRKP